MSLTRRKALTLMGSALLAPAVLRPRPARADSITLPGLPRLVDGSLPGPTSNPVAAAFPNGRFVITFMQGTFPNTRAYARWFTAASVPLGPSVQFGGTGALPAGPVAIPDGRVMAVFTRDDGSGNSFDVFGQRFSASRTPVGSPFRLNQNRTGLQFGQPPVLLPNGNFAEAWQDIGVHDVEGRVFTPGGFAVTGDKKLALEAGIEEAIDFKRSVICYRNAPSFAGPTTYSAQRLDFNLNQVGTPINLDSVSPGWNYRAMRSATHSDSSFTIMWQDTNASGLILRARRFSVTGTALNSFVILDGQNQIAPDLAELVLAALRDTAKIGLVRNEKGTVSGKVTYWITASIVDTRTGLRTAGKVRISKFETNPNTQPRSLVTLSDDGAGNFKVLATWTGGTSVLSRAYFRLVDLEAVKL